MSNKITLAYTNMPSNRQNYDFGFAKTLCLNASVATVGDIGLAIAALTHGKLMNFSIVCDKHHVEHPEVFMEILNEKINGFIGTLIKDSK